ncbi:Unknown protein, partial [Striga hermonthica]
MDWSKQLEERNGKEESTESEGCVQVAVSCWIYNGRLGMGGKAQKQNKVMQMWDASKDFRGNSVETHLAGLC